MKRVLIVITVILLASAVFIITREKPLARIKSFVPNKHVPLVFAVIGDTETHNDLYEAALNEAKKRGAKFVLHTGDLIENGTDEEFIAARAVAERVGLPVHVAIGNHDYPDDLSRAPFERYVHAPNAVFEYDGIRFVTLDNADRKTGFSEDTLSWLEDEFRARPSSRHVLVYHRPFDLPFSALTGDDETPTSRASNERFISLFPLTKIDMIFNGHVHAYVPYTLNGIRAYVTGGGGGEAQDAISLLANTGPHFLMGTVRDDRIDTEVVQIR